jgi:2-polyprenyl-3-methyl-5-hydroxy-6-metoxy-1,4-benzoquinol methylase
MATGDLSISDYDRYVDAYLASVTRRERGEGGDAYGILPHLLDLLGDLAGKQALDAACGEGFLARALAARGAWVTGIDLSPRLIEAARKKDPDQLIGYRVADLSQPLPDLAGRFDIVASYLALNDVADYRGFIATLAASLRPGGRMAIALNNPYGAVIRKHVADYFESGAVKPYPGLWSVGIRTYYHHRTLQDYLDAFLGAGLCLTRLADLTAMASVSEAQTILPMGGRFPRFMVLGFSKM